MTIAALALAALTTLTAGAATGAAKAPASFYGVVPQTTLGSSDLERMGNGKVGTLRSWVNWAAIDSEPGTADNNWVSFDPIVLEAARNDVEVLPFIFGTPQWVAKELDNSNCGGAKCSITAPKSGAALDAWESFVGEAVDRYGPNGEFWAEHPKVPETPILAWQIWNEQNSKSFYAPKPSPKGYAKLLAAAARAITSRDAGADVVLGGMAELAGSRKAIPGSKYLADLYRVKGAKKSFDAVAPHPYGASVAKVSSQVDLYRKAMKRGGDSGAGMYVTEIGAGSASGGNPLNRGKKGQANLLKDIYKYFLKKRNAFNVATVNWFSWQDSPESICDWCKSSGLLTKSGKAKPAYKAFTKLTGGSAGKH